MNTVKGMVVKSTAGRDSGGDFVATEVSDDRVLIADGGERPVERPKKESPKHISPTGMRIDTDGLTNKRLRRLLGELLNKAET